jgi:hypothetical protein
MNYSFCGHYDGNSPFSTLYVFELHNILNTRSTYVIKYVGG